MRAASLAALALLLGATARAAAQDFAPAIPSAVSAGASSLLEDGLPPPRDGIAAAAGVTRWFGLDALQTRHAALAAGWRGARAAVGVSQTGEPELGWTSLAAAAGGASRAAGAAFRAIARMDRDRAGLPGSSGAGAGGEIGGGAWVRAGPVLRVHVAAPQIARWGEAPPLARGFEIGAVASRASATAWLVVRSAPAAESAPPDHEAGLALGAGSCRAWALARDRPLRGGIGIAGRVRGLEIAAAAESHPVLGASTRLGIGVGAAAP